MPKYEYQCPKCKTTFEVLHLKVTDKKEACPNCGENSEKIISLSTFILNGGYTAENGYSKKAGLNNGRK